LNNLWERYLKKLEISRATAPSKDFLQALHMGSVKKIAFENIDPFLGKPVSLDISDLAHKILEQGRGGYCFELNGIFLAALREFGFLASAALARVFMGRPNPGPRTHQVSLVEIGGETWLADVGFGGPGLMQAIPFRSGYEEVQLGRKIRLRFSEDWGMLYEEELKDGWRTIYSIPSEKTEEIDLITGNHYCATHINSIFRNNLYCAGESNVGRITIFNRSIMKFNGEKVDLSMNSPLEICSAFREIGVRIDQDQAHALHLSLDPVLN
jgi:N-hydroxyarylamine O-acetyltransferase